MKFGHPRPISLFLLLFYIQSVKIKLLLRQLYYEQNRCVQFHFLFLYILQSILNIYMTYKKLTIQIPVDISIYIYLLFLTFELFQIFTGTFFSNFLIFVICLYKATQKFLNTIFVCLNWSHLFYDLNKTLYRQKNNVTYYIYILHQVIFVK